MAERNELTEGEQDVGTYASPCGELIPTSKALEKVLPAGLEVWKQPWSPADCTPRDNVEPDGQPRDDLPLSLCRWSGRVLGRYRYP